jgi:hypothetical protein
MLLGPPAEVRTADDRPKHGRRPGPAADEIVPDWNGLDLVARPDDESVQDC